MAFTVDELSVILTGNATGMNNAMKSAEETARKTADSIEKQAGRITGFMSSLKNFGTTVLGIFSALKVGDFFKQTTSAFKEMKDILEELADATFENDAFDWEETVAGHKKFAIELENVLAVSRKTTLSLLAEAEALELNGEAAQKAVKGAQALAKVTGFEASGFLGALSVLDFKGRGGGTGQLEQLFPALSKIKEPTERMAAAQKLLAEAFAESEKMAGTWQGKLASLTHSYSALKVVVGEVVTNIADTAKVVAGALFEGVGQAVTRVAETIRSIVNTVIEPAIREAFGDDALKGIDLTWEGIKQAVVDAGNLIKLVFINIGNIVGPIWTGIETVVAVALDIMVVGVQSLAHWMMDSAGGGKILAFGLELVATAATSAYLTLNTLVSIISAFVGSTDEAAGNAEDAADAIEDATQATSKWVEVAMDAARMTAAIAGSVGVLILVYKGLQITLTLTMALMSALKIQQLASLALWGAWKVAIIAATVVSTVFNAQLAVYNFLLGIGTVGSAAWTAGVLVAKAATWLWNAALTVTNILLAPAVLLAAAGTILIIGGAIATVAAAAWGAYKAASALIEVLAGVDFKDSPIGQVGKMFSGWVGMIRDVVVTARKDLPLAWELLQKGFDVAVAEIKALFPPLFSFITQGFKIVGETIDRIFKVTAEQASFNIKHAIIDAVTFSPFGKTERRLNAEKIVEDQNKSFAFARETAIATAMDRIGKLGGGLKVPETEEVKAAKEAYAKALAAAQAFVPKEGKGGGFLQNLLKGMVDPKFLEREAEQAAERQARLMAEGQKVIDQTKTPEERFAEKKKKLDELFGAGALGKGAAGIEVYNRALEKMQKELHGTTAAFHSFNAAAVGSTEDVTRLQQYLERNFGTKSPFMGVVDKVAAAAAVAQASTQLPPGAMAGPFDRDSQVAVAQTAVNAAMEREEALRGKLGTVTDPAEQEKLFNDIAAAEGATLAAYGELARARNAPPGKGSPTAIVELLVQIRDAIINKPVAEFEGANFDV